MTIRYADTNGGLSPWLARGGIKDLTKYRVDPTFYRLNNFVLMNLDRWKALPQATRQALDRIAQDYEVESAKFYLNEAKKDEAALTSAGMEIIALKGEAAKAYRGAANDAIIARISKMSEPETVKALVAKLTK